MRDFALAGQRAVFQRLSRWQAARPWAVILAALATLLPCAWMGAGLRIRSSFQDLLPPSLESVAEQQRLAARMGGSGTLIVAIEGTDFHEHLPLIDAISARIAALGPAYVRGVDDGMRQERRFVEQHWYLYVPEDELGRLGDEAAEIKDREVMKRAGLDLGLDDGEAVPLGSIRSRLRLPALGRFGERVPDYYVSDDGTLCAIVVRTGFDEDEGRLRRLQREVEEIVTGTGRAQSVALSASFTGSAVAKPEEHRAVVSDLAHVGLWGAGLVLGVVLLYFLRLRVLAALALALGVGCTWTVAFAAVSVGHFNSASGFLFSIVAGNGINFGIIYTARYLEARSEEGLSVDGAIARAHDQSWRATLAASCAAAAAYGSLAVTDLPAFRHFGVIGGAGLLLCWIAAYTVLPAALVVSERFGPLANDSGDWRCNVRLWVAGALFRAVSRYPRAVALASLCVVGACAVATLEYIAGGPMETDMRNLRNDAAEPGSARALARRVAPLVGPLSRDGRAIVVDRLDQVAPVVAELRRRRAAAPPDAAPFGRVISVLDLVPPDQDKHLAAARPLEDTLKLARARGLLDDREADAMGLGPLGFQEVSVEDLPGSIAWRFEEADGSVGRVVYVEPAAGRSLNDARYLEDLANGIRRIALPDGSVVRGSGDPVVFADLLDAVRRQSGWAVLASVAGTLLVILVAFRGRAAGWLSLCCVVAGMSVLLGGLSLLGIRLNFLNIMALPITVGVGADYAINVLRRRELELDGERTPARAFVQTGGAVVLCSLTTILGYLALLGSANGAVRSFGLAAALGEVIMVLVATVVLPAVLLSEGAIRRSAHVADNRGCRRLRWRQTPQGAASKERF